MDMTPQHMSEPTLLQEKYPPPDDGSADVEDAADMWALIQEAKKQGYLVPVEVSIGAAVNVMNEEGWTCDGHEPGAWCTTCLKLQTATAEKMLVAGLGEPA